MKEVRNKNQRLKGDFGFLSNILGSSSIFHVRILDSVMFQDLKPCKFHSWICDGLTESQIFALTLTCQTSKEIFLKSDSHIFIQDLDSWKEIIQQRLKRFGFGDIISVSGEEHNTGFVIEKSHSSPIFIGMLVGMWERATGKASQCTISFEDNNISLQITTLLEYAP